MSSNPAPSLPQAPWRRPWPVLLSGVAITAVGLILFAAGEGPTSLRFVLALVHLSGLAPIRFVLFLAGLITAGAALSMRFRVAGWQFDERMETAGMLAVAAFAALLAFIGSDPWDSMQIVLVALIAVALLGVVLVLLPTTARTIVVGVLVLVHFGGMITAATTIEPPGASAPWVSRELWANVYRRYLQFMYLNNAYHFYSPEPGPPALVWFHIKYADGQVKWFKIPHRDEDPLPIHHTRLLSITESTAVASTQPPQDPGRWSDLKSARERAGELFDIEVAPDYVMPEYLQYQETQTFSQKMIESYVRHVAWEFPSLGDPANTVKSIKVYRLRHKIISPQEVAEGRSPLDKLMYIGFYQGEYDAAGKLLHAEYDADGNVTVVNDPFRFWYMPIYYRPKDHSKFYRPNMKPDELELFDGVTRHAQLDLDAKTISKDPNDTPWDDGAETKQP
jgi:hypothetical protein